MWILRLESTRWKQTVCTDQFRLSISSFLFIVLSTYEYIVLYSFSVRSTDRQSDEFLAVNSSLSLKVKPFSERFLIDYTDEMLQMAMRIN